MTEEKTKALLDDVISLKTERLNRQRNDSPKYCKIIPEVKVLHDYPIENKIRVIESQRSQAVDRHGRFSFDAVPLTPMTTIGAENEV